MGLQIYKVQYLKSIKRETLINIIGKNADDIITTTWIVIHELFKQSGF